MKPVVKGLLSAAFGVVAGAVCGLFGGGGGMLAVPFFGDILRLPPKKAHGTALFSVLPPCAVCAAVYLLSGAFPADGWPAAAAVPVGAAAGALLLPRVPGGILRPIFAAVLIAAGITTLVR